MWSLGGVSNAGSSLMRVLNKRVLIQAHMMGKTVLLAWLIAEAITYVLVLVNFSLLAGLLIGIGSTGLGLLVLRMVGRKVASESAIHLNGFDSLADLKTIPLALLGAILLLLPGFLSDLAGLILVLIGGRSLLRPQTPSPRARHVDLGRDEWTRLPDDESPR